MGPNSTESNRLIAFTGRGEFNGQTEVDEFDGGIRSTEQEKTVASLYVATNYSEELPVADSLLVHICQCQQQLIKHSRCLLLFYSAILKQGRVKFSASTVLEYQVQFLNVFVPLIQLHYVWMVLFSSTLRKLRVHTVSSALFLLPRGFCCVSSYRLF